MDSLNPLSQSGGFMDLLNSREYNVSPIIGLGSYEVPLFSSQWREEPIQVEQTPEDKKGRRNWLPKEDVVLISAWLNTSKNPVIGNEQNADTFWKRIGEHTVTVSKRWGKINDQVCKFVGCLEAATSQKSSGQNENDVMKLANQIYLNDHGVKFTLEHCWRELRHDQKWCAAAFTTDNGLAKRRKCDNDHEASEHGEESARPPGVKASKAKAKRPIKGDKEEGNGLKEFQSIWEIKQKDFKLREKLSKHKMLENLLGKTEPLSDTEVALKDKLINDML